jgi:cyclophilin family peptidyl-prolyl cis-trans isomerase
MARILTLLLFASVILTSCAQKKDYVVTFKTKYGDMVAILYDETPKHKENFIKLAKEHYYDSLLFHRVMENFMIQAGDPDSKHAQPGQPLGVGSPGYTIPAEFNEKFIHEKGALSAARIPDNQNPKKESSGSQFYIVQGQVWPESELTIDQNKLNNGIRQLMQNPNYAYLQDTLGRLYYAGDMEAYKNKMISLAPVCEKELGISVKKEVSPEKLKVYTTTGGSPHLDGEYTVFGKVISGLDVIDKIAAVEVDQRDRPLENVMLTVTVEEMSKKKITKKYGYQYPEPAKK